MFDKYGFLKHLDQEPDYPKWQQEWSAEIKRELGPGWYEDLKAAEQFYTRKVKEKMTELGWITQD
jgi:hypothetical protein